MRFTSNWEDYRKFLVAAGYKITEGKHQTYTAPDGIHKIRGGTIGSEYTKEGIEEFWKLRKNIQAMIGAELENNTKISTMTYENLKDLFKTGEKFYAMVPRVNSNTGKPYQFKFQLNNNRRKEILDTYINDAVVFPIYRGKNEKIGSMYGKDIKDVLLERDRETYEEQKRWEQMENEQKEKDLNALLKEYEKQSYFSRPGWDNSSTNKPYFISLYDDEGNRRSLIEEIFIFALMVITNEIPDFALSERDRERLENERNINVALIIQKPSWKTEKIIEAIQYAKEENITDLDSLNAKLQNTGKEYSRLKKALSKNTEVREKMQNLHSALLVVEALTDLAEKILNMPEGPDKENQLKTHQNELAEYKAAKAVLYHNGLGSKDKHDDFKTRWQYNTEQDERLQKELKKARVTYTKLKKIKNQVDLALNKEYCYGQVQDRKRQRDEKELEKNE